MHASSGETAALSAALQAGPPTAATEPAARPAAGDASYGVLRIGEADVALPLQALREAVPCPARLAGLPANAAGLLGAMNLRGRVLPVVDVRPLLGQPAGRQAGQVVVLVRQQPRPDGPLELIGLLADGVHGLVKCPPAALHAMACGDGSPLLFSASFERGDGSGVVSLLDVPALMRLPGVPVLREPPPAADAPAAPGGAGARRPLMLLRCGDVGLAIDVTLIHATLPGAALAPSAMAGGICRGVFAHAGTDVPAVDPLALLGLGRLDDAETHQALLLRGEHGLVALMVSRVVEIVRVTEAELLPLPAMSARAQALLPALLNVPAHGEHLLIDAAAVLAEPRMTALSSLNTQRPGSPKGSAAGKATSGRGAARGRAVISYFVGPEFASPLAQVSEVLALPRQRTVSASTHPAVMGLFTHRRQAVLLVCLARLLGRGPALDDASARVLLVATAHGPVGYVVPRLNTIEDTVWEQPAAPAAAAEPTGAGQAAARAAIGLAGHPVIEVGEAGARRTLHLLDLQALAATLLH